MNDPLKHHFIPEFYLRQWSGSDGNLCAYHRPYRNVVPKRYAPSAVAYQLGLYSLDGYGEQIRNSLERDYMGPIIDDPAARAFKVLLERDNAKLTPELRHAWTRFLLMLMFRTPQMVAEITRQAAQTLRDGLMRNPEEYEAVRAEGHPPTFLEWAEKYTPAVFDGLGKSLLPALANDELNGTVIIRMNWWTVAVGEEGRDLLTSDSPLHTTHGIGDARCLIMLPLSPRFVFFATRNPALVEATMANGAGKVIRALNDTIVRQAQHYVFGSDDRHLRFVENRLRRQPGAATMNPANPGPGAEAAAARKGGE